MLNRFKIKLQHLLPQQGLTRLVGWGADQQGGWLTQAAIKGFVRYYHINLQEARYPDLSHYQTFNQFFIRALHPDARPLNEHPDTLVFPADGTLSQFGHIAAGKILQAKGLDYTLEALLAGQYQWAEIFENGLFATIYLSPGDYHRVHMPCDAILQEMIYVPGDLFSVNLLTAANIPNLFARNERLILFFTTHLGPMAQILVGATIVGSIATVWSGRVNSSREGIIQRWCYPDRGPGAVILKKGEEMGHFKLGSTVINLFAANQIEFDSHLSQDIKTQIGKSFAHQLPHLSPKNSAS